MRSNVKQQCTLISSMLISAFCTFAMCMDESSISELPDSMIDSAVTELQKQMSSDGGSQQHSSSWSHSEGSECLTTFGHKVAGVCMPLRDCIQQKGFSSYLCKQNSGMGTCCKLSDNNYQEAGDTQSQSVQSKVASMRPDKLRDLLMLSQATSPSKFSWNTQSNLSSLVDAMKDVVSTQEFTDQLDTTINDANEPQAAQLITESPTISHGRIERPTATQVSCGRTNSARTKGTNRLVGGTDAKFAEFPWIISLRITNKYGRSSHICGASLLNERWAITAAHCVHGKLARQFSLRLGEFDFTNQRDESSPHVERRARKIIVHPHYNAKNNNNDIALIRFDSPIDYNDNILPICLPSQDKSYLKQMATLAGWGRLSEGGASPRVLQKVDVQILANRDCENMYRIAKMYAKFPNVFICAGSKEGGRDHCHGDSGGPLSIVESDGRAYLIGIVSWAYGCAQPNRPGANARVSIFFDWINRIISQ